MTVTTSVPYRSFSQWSDYTGCSWYYYLRRIHRDENGDRLVPVPAAWFPHGVGYHSGAEFLEANGRQASDLELERVFNESFEAEVKHLESRVPVDKWYWSGPYAPRQDLKRRKALGLAQLYKYRDHANAHGKKLWRGDNDAPGTELELTSSIGGVDVRVVIDLVQIAERQVIEIVDHKTGSRPGKDLQLATAAVALEQECGVKATSGHFYMAREGKETNPVMFSDWPASRVGDTYSELEQNIQAERFEPNPSKDQCTMCSLAKYCDFAVYK